MSWRAHARPFYPAERDDGYVVSAERAMNARRAVSVPSKSSGLGS